MSEHILRTPESRFTDLPDFPWSPMWVTVSSGDDFPPVRMAFIDEGDPDGPPVLLLHGEPSWGFLYRHMIPIFIKAGFRTITPDLIGFGRSDKPKQLEDYTYERHSAWLRSLVETLNLRDISMVCQDWGGLLGLRLLAEMPDRFSAVVASNTFLPTGEEKVPSAFLKWREFSQTVPEFPVGGVLDMGTVSELSEDVKRAYDAPFPDDSYKAGARIFPKLVPVAPDDPGAARNRRSWEVLSSLEVPFLVAFGDSDPITGGAAAILRESIAGALGKPHCTIEGAGHFIQEDKPKKLATVARDFFLEHK